MLTVDQTATPGPTGDDQSSSLDAEPDSRRDVTLSTKAATARTDGLDDPDAAEEEKGYGHGV